VLLLAGALVAIPSTAEAQMYVHQDARGDMDETSKSGWPAAPEQVNGDIIRMRAWHTAKRVRVRLVFAELKPGSDVWVAAHFRFWTNEHVVRDVHLEAYPGHWKGTIWMTRFRDGAQVRCSTHWAFDFAQNVVVFGLPRRCLSQPRWVQISAASSTAVWDGQGMAWPPSYADNAQRTNLATSNYLNPSPRIFRG
jgi:hypothetical protein